MLTARRFPKEQPCLLLHLPIEIRHQVYHELQIDRGGCNEAVAIFRRSRQLLHACRNLRYDVFEYIGQRVTVDVNIYTKMLPGPELGFNQAMQRIMMHGFWCDTTIDREESNCVKSRPSLVMTAMAYDCLLSVLGALPNIETLDISFDIDSDDEPGGQEGWRTLESAFENMPSLKLLTLGLRADWRRSYPPGPSSSEMKDLIASTEMAIRNTTMSFGNPG